MTLDIFSDQEIYELASPIWKEMSIHSNAVNYDGFSALFTDELKGYVTKDRFEKQCGEFPLLTSFTLESYPIACLRRHDGVCVVFKLFSDKIDGEFLGHITLVSLNGIVQVNNAQVY